MSVLERIDQIGEAKLNFGMFVFWPRHFHYLAVVKFEAETGRVIHKEELLDRYECRRGGCHTIPMLAKNFIDRT
jgi:hypothetical protein